MLDIAMSVCLSQCALQHLMEAATSVRHSTEKTSRVQRHFTAGLQGETQKITPSCEEQVGYRNEHATPVDCESSLRSASDEKTRRHRRRCAENLRGEIEWNGLLSSNTCEAMGRYVEDVPKQGDPPRIPSASPFATPHPNPPLPTQTPHSPLPPAPRTLCCLLTNTLVRL